MIGNRRASYTMVGIPDGLGAYDNADGAPGNGQLGVSRLWAITFNNVNDLAKAVASGNISDVGTIQLLIDGAPVNMMDNMGINAQGVVSLDEDTGKAAHNPKTWQYNTKNGDLTQIFESDPNLFGNLTPWNQYTPPTAPFNADKEPSGALDVTDLFKDASWRKPGTEVILADYQAHMNYPSDSPLVEGGQLDLLIRRPGR